MELTTAGPRTRMPSSVHRRLEDGTLELSTVHQPAWELSFYSDVRKAFCEYQQFIAIFVDHALSTLSPRHVTETAEAATSGSAGEAPAIIEKAKRGTGLSVKDLAAVFQVSRQTLYNYRKSQENITDRNWERLQAVERQVEVLAGILPYGPGTLMKRFSLGGDTLYELLCADVLDDARIRQLATALAGQMKAPADAGVRHSASVDQLTRHA